MSHTLFPFSLYKKKMGNWERDALEWSSFNTRRHFNKKEWIFVSKIFSKWLRSFHSNLFVNKYNDREFWDLS
jgi:hypothetical protein